MCAAFFFFPLLAQATEAEYREKVVFDTVSLVVAAENNASPASMMGHSFLKIVGGGRQHAFGYYTVLNKGILSYWDALTGNQSGLYALSPYQKKAKEYLIDEGRALWEFELDLSEAEKESLKREIWKTNGKNDTYSFVSHNCNTAVEELLTTVNPDFKRKTVKPFTTPVEYARYLYDIEKIKSINYVRPPDKKGKSVKNILAANPSSRLAVEYGKHATYLEFSPVYQDLRTVADAYDFETETKMLSIRLKIKDKVRLDKVDILNLFSVQPISKYLRVGYESGGVIESGVGGGIVYNGFSAYALPIVGARDSAAFTGVKVGMIQRFADKAKAIVSYEIATDRTVFNSYFGFGLTETTELYAQYKHRKSDEALFGLAWYF